MASDVPYYRQAAIGSCGPACLMMLFKFHRPEMTVGRSLEIRVWMGASLWPFGMTEAFGLANFAVKQGFAATVVKEDMELRMSFPEKYVHPAASRTLLYLARARYWRLRRGALGRGVHSVAGQVLLYRIEEALSKGIPPIVMVDQGSYAPDRYFSEGVLHWVVVTGCRQGEVFLNDPELGKGVRLSREQFEKAMDLSSFGKDREMLLVGQDSQS